MKTNTIFIYLIHCLLLGVCKSQRNILSVYNSRSNRGDCYVRVRSNLRLQSFHVNSKRGVNSLSECERECDLSQTSCNSFSYNDNTRGRPGNCLLSRASTRTLNVRSLIDYKEDDDFDYYEKGDVLQCRRTSYNIPQVFRSTSSCFRLAHRRAKVPAIFVRRSLRSSDQTDCEKRCLMEKTFACRGVNYRYRTRSAFITQDNNCQLVNAADFSDRSVFYDDEDFDFYERTGFQRECSGSGLDFPYGRDDDDYNRYDRPGNKFFWDDQYDNDDCYTVYRKGYGFSFSTVKERFSVGSLRECQRECKQIRSFNCRAIAFRYTRGGSIHYGENCHLTDIDARSLNRFDLIPDATFDVYSKENRMYNGRCNNDNNDDYYDDGDDDYYGREGHQTVAGVQCMDRCREDRAGRFYMCETDYQGGWDYCCRPRDYCRYTNDMQVKWCYVGSHGTTQWRPCYSQVGGRRAFLQEEEPRNASTTKKANQILKKRKDDEKPLELVDLNDIV